jgi:transcriptional regulator
MTFEPRSRADILALIAEHPLAWVVSTDFDATLLPLLAECDENGELVSLFGHYARRNPQVTAFEQDGSALILFNGPAGYISPKLVSNPRWGPTWNYAAVRVVADLVFVPDETDASLRCLSEHLEPDGGWRVERMGARYGELARHVVAFRATVRTCEATFKLGQDEAAQTRAEIIAGHINRRLTAAMFEQENARDPGI